MIRLTGGNGAQLNPRPGACTGQTLDIQRVGEEPRAPDLSWCQVLGQARLGAGHLTYELEEAIISFQKL